MTLTIDCSERLGSNTSVWLLFVGKAISLVHLVGYLASTLRLKKHLGVLGDI